jgi:hypothetical protein
MLAPTTLARCAVGGGAAERIVRDAALAAARGVAVVLAWCDELETLAEGLAPLVRGLPPEARAQIAGALLRLSAQDPRTVAGALATVIGEVAVHRNVVLCLPDVDRADLRARAVVAALLADPPPALLLLSVRDAGAVELPSWVERC